MPAFQHSLFGCFDNCGICLITYFIPCYTQGRIAEKVGESCIACGLIQLVPIANCICATHIRGKVRAQKNIEGSLVSDLLTIWCCYCCGLVQEAQEVNAIGSNSMTRE